MWRAGAGAWTLGENQDFRIPGYLSVGMSAGPANVASGAISTSRVTPALQALGAITTDAASGTLAFTVSTAASSCQTVVVSNSNVGTSSTVILTIQEYTGTRYANGSPVVYRQNASGVSNNAFTLAVCNDHATKALSGNLLIGFWVLN